jgi:hypothetical protein
MKSVVSQRRRPFNVDFSQGSRKNQLEPGQESVGDVSRVLSRCSLLRNYSPKLTSVLENFRERETNCWFLNFGGISF